ncbi:hypothetical protein Q9L58_005751 [Maublancomyces gigas]|uniref:Centromere protein X n=1 Tax=Discina gigas TaxID=1032678 RepID=A0ABR3GHC0_9PEZI
MPPRRAVDTPSPPLPSSSEEDKNDISLPPQLLQRLLQEFFEEKKTRISRPALNATGEYTKTFIREAIWRATAIRKEREQDPGSVRNMSAFLEVEDLEKLSPQLLLDF